MHKLISLLSFSVVNKTVHNNRPTVFSVLSPCGHKSVMWRQTNWPICDEGDKSESVIFSLLCPSRLLYAVLCRSCLGQSCAGHVPWATPPTPPPIVEDMFSVCLTQCIFNELRLLSVLHSMGINDANMETYRSHIVLALGSINNNVTYKNLCEGFLQQKPEHKL